MDWTDDELIELYEERAAIREHDGGMSRAEAEKAAYWDWRRMVGRKVSAPDHIRILARKFGNGGVEDGQAIH